MNSLVSSHSLHRGGTSRSSAGYASAYLVVVLAQRVQQRRQPALAEHAVAVREEHPHVLGRGSHWLRLGVVAVQRLDGGQADHFGQLAAPCSWRRSLQAKHADVHRRRLSRPRR
eukprot:CAMPEP_0201093998 /NCGR_PEP_ID=MMETSP0812-20130820/2419_1 /ASSEMBLY_ACC=CAM_ASM_000668 /TAXON_ID=98059 /ORGANISM="Dinobryon sp., Strain UTEXLB2267" /LENGTH=113 /DNA_ID=CAMNT_0047346427 /DNA_START=342 /DNA_END=686 /DNA_ORIENTATION=+